MALDDEQRDRTAPMLGERVRMMRHFRHKTIAEVAGLAGISASYLSLLERGLRPLDSRRLLHGLADVLECSVAELTGEPVPATSVSHAAALAAMQDVRVALAEADDDGTGKLLRSVSDVASDGDKVLKLFMDCRYGECGRLLAPLIREVSTADGRQLSDLFHIRARAYFTAWSLATSLGFLDLALRAAEMTNATAVQSDDPVLVGAGGFARAQALDRIGVSRKSLSVCQRAADRIQDASLGSRSVQQVYGTLHLHAAQTCAVLGNLSDTEAHLAEAATAAQHIGEPSDRPGPDGNIFELHFGPTNVELWRLAIAVEIGEGGRAPEIVRYIDQTALPSPNRRAFMYADLGRGLAQERGKDREAVNALCEAERIAPDLIHSTPLVRETITDLLRRARRKAGGRNLTGLAYRIGIIHRRAGTDRLI